VDKIYLAIPFTGCEEISFKYANEIAALLIGEGHFVFSPISHSYPIWKTNLVEHSFDTWLELDKNFVDWASEIHVVVFEEEGWLKIKNSKGVQLELDWAKEKNKPIKYLEYNLQTHKINYFN